MMRLERDFVNLYCFPSFAGPIQEAGASYPSFKYNQLLFVLIIVLW